MGTRGVHNPNVNKRDREVAKEIMDALDGRLAFRSDDRTMLLEYLSSYRYEIVSKVRNEQPETRRTDENQDNS